MSADAALTPSNANPLHPNTSLGSPSPESEVTSARDAAAPAEPNALTSTPDLHKEFRNLTLLLRFLTAVNGGHPTLPDRSAPKFSDLARRKESVIDAVTTILVREHEIVAAAAYKGGAGSIVCQSVPKIGPQSREAVDVAPAGSPAGLSDFGHDHDIDIPYMEDDATKESLNVAAIANPDYADGHTFLPPLPTGPKVISGTDFWPELTTNSRTVLKA